MDGKLTEKVKAENQRKDYPQRMGKMKWVGNDSL